MYEYQLLSTKNTKNIKIFRRPIYRQSDIDNNQYVSYTLCDIIDPIVTRSDLHHTIRTYLDKNGIKSNVYMFLTKFGNFKYLFNKRPSKSSPLIQFSPYRDGECDVYYKQDMAYLEERWRVFNEFVDESGLNSVKQHINMTCPYCGDSQHTLCLKENRVLLVKTRIIPSVMQTSR